MLETLIILLAAHFIADFPAQTNWMVKQKSKPHILLLHLIIVGAVAVILLGSVPPLLLAVLLGSHLIMDAIKVYAFREETHDLPAFVLDQCVHILVIIGLAWAFPNILATSWWPDILPPEFASLFLPALIVISALIAVTHAGGLLIQKMMKPFTDQLDNSDDGLTDGGKFIGYLERGLIILLFLTGNPEGVGFLIAAKSILRFGEIKDSENRKMSEYIIIGTFMSFGWAMLIGFVSLQAHHALASG